MEYNRERPHSSLDDLTPEEFVAQALAMPERSVSLTADSIPCRTKSGSRSHRLEVAAVLANGAHAAGEHSDVKSLICLVKRSTASKTVATRGSVRPHALFEKICSQSDLNRAMRTTS
jgi:hypothetical protein